MKEDKKNTQKKDTEIHGVKETVDKSDIEMYDDVTVDSEEDTGIAVKKLRKQLKECAHEKQEYLDGWQRLRADFANYKAREGESKEDFVKFAKEGLISELIPVVDSFEMAFANKEAWENVDENWRKGVEYIHTQLETVLENNGLKELDPLGSKFDPAQHTSIETIRTDDPKKDHVICEVVQKGYIMNDKVIRSPRVKIYEYSTETPVDDTN